MMECETIKSEHLLFTLQTLANLERSSGVRNSHIQTIQSKGRQSRLHSSLSTESCGDCMMVIPAGLSNVGQRSLIMVRAPPTQ